MTSTVFDLGASVIWLTGISSSGKTTMARVLKGRLDERGVAAHIVDADELRLGLNHGLGLQRAEVIESVRRITHAAKLIFDAGVTPIVACVSPYRDQRFAARALVPEGRFIEVFMDTPLDVAQQRDVSGIYKLARTGNLRGVAGLDAPYERPVTCDVHIRSNMCTPRAGAGYVMSYLLQPLPRARAR